MTDEATQLYIEGIQAYGRKEHDVAVERYQALGNAQPQSHPRYISYRRFIGPDGLGE